MNLNILTPEVKVFSGEVDSVNYLEQMENLKY
jgi:F0F1-type ATP synthase epsilon subunit